MTVLGILGGSGVYVIWLDLRRAWQIASPFGETSDDSCSGS
jgi:hypothetical protein